MVIFSVYKGIIMRFYTIHLYQLVLVLCFTLMISSCSDRKSSNDNTAISQIASDPTNICSVSSDNHSSALCYRIGDNANQQLSATVYSGKVSGHVDAAGLTKITLELDGNAKISLQSMATGIGTVTTYHEGRGSSTYQTTGGEYYTQTASSTEDGGKITFTNYSSEPGSRMAGHFDIKLCKYDMVTHVVDCVNNMIQLVGAFDVGVANPVCAVEPEGNSSSICYQIGSRAVQNVQTDNVSVLRAYFSSSDNTTKILLNPSTYDNELNLSTGGIATGEAEMSTSGNSYYGDNSSYIRYSRSEIDGGSIIFTKYGIVGERLEGNFATTLCNYDFNMKTYAGTHSINCEDKSIWIRGAFSIPRSADQ